MSCLFLYHHLATPVIFCPLHHLLWLCPKPHISTKSLLKRLEDNDFFSPSLGPFCSFCWDNLKPKIWAICLQRQMVLIRVTTWEYSSKNLLHLQNFYPPESPAVHTHWAAPTHTSGEPGQTSPFLKAILLEHFPEYFMLLLLFLLHLLLPHLEWPLQAKPLKTFKLVMKNSLCKHVWLFLLLPPRLHFLREQKPNLTQDTLQTLALTNKWTAWVKKTNLSPLICFFSFSQRLWKREIQ